MEYQGKIIKINKNQVTISYKERSPGPACWTSSGDDGSSHFRTISCKNTLNAKLGDIVLFTKPDISQIFLSLNNFIALIISIIAITFTKKYIRTLNDGIMILIIILIFITINFTYNCFKTYKYSKINSRSKFEVKLLEIIDNW